MALKLTKGNISSNNFSSSPDTRIRFVDPRVFLAQAAIAPLMTLLEKYNRKVQAKSTKIESNEKDIGTPTTTLNGAISDSDTTVNIATGEGAMFDKNDILWIPSTDEQMLVTARTTDALTVTRAFGSVAADAAADGAEVVKLSSAYAENGTSGVGVAINPIMPYNMTQIMRTPIDLSRTEMQTDRYGQPGGALKERLNDAMILHMEAKERAFINGQLKDDTSNSRRTCKGVLRFITTNRENMSSSLTKKKFDSFLKDVMFNGGGNYYFFSSGTFLEALHAEVLATSNYNTDFATKEFGLDIDKYRSPFGRCNIVYHRVLSHMLEGQYGGCGILLNLDLLTEYYIQKMIVKSNIQANDADGRMDEYLEECCPMLNNEMNHGFIYGV